MSGTRSTLTRRGCGNNSPASNAGCASSVGFTEIYSLDAVPLSEIPASLAYQGLLAFDRGDECRHPLMKIWIIGWLKSPYLAAHYG